jgi:hypothetical protein
LIKAAGKPLHPEICNIIHSVLNRDVVSLGWGYGFGLEVAGWLMMSEWMSRLNFTFIDKQLNE